MTHKNKVTHWAAPMRMKVKYCSNQCRFSKRKLCYRKDDRAMRPIYRLFYHNFVHAYVHYFVRIWFWTNLSWSDSAHWSDVDFEKPIVVTIAAHSDICLHVLKHHLGVLDGDAPSPMEPPRMLYFIFLETKIMGVHFVADSIFIIFIAD